MIRALDFLFQILTLSLEPKRITAWDVYRSTPEMPPQSTLLATVDLETKNSKNFQLEGSKDFETRKRVELSLTKSEYQKLSKKADLEGFTPLQVEDLKVLGEEPWKWRTNLTGLVLTCNVKDVSSCLR